MSFETPGALWGLLSLLLLLVLSLWRQAAARTVVPSVLLWKRIPERNPPMHALRRPRWRLELLLQAAALAAMVAGLAGPFRRSDRPRPRRVAFVFDTSARMLAGDRLERAREAARAIRSRLGPEDVVAVYAAVPSPRRLERLEEVAAVHVHVDPAPLLAAAREEADHVLYFSDRPPERLPKEVRPALFGGPGGNAGIVEFSASDTGVFARLANHGPSRRVPLELTLGERVLRLETFLPPGESPWHHAVPLDGVGRVSLRLAVPDAFPLDNEAHAVRWGSARTEVSLSGRHVPDLVRALESVGSVLVRRGKGGGAMAVGVDEEPGEAPFRVRLVSPEDPRTPAAVAVRGHPLTTALRGEDFRLARVGVLPVPPGAEPLLLADGRPFAVLQGRTLHLSVELSRGGWPASVSFPVFWTNAVDFARRGAGSFFVVRTGRPVALPAGVEKVTAREGGAQGGLDPGGRFLTHWVGSFEAQGPGGRWEFRSSLLDARESDTAGVDRRLDWDPDDPAVRIPAREPLGGFLAALALALVAGSWILQGRPD